MTPNDLDEYLGVFVRHQAMAAVLKLPDGVEVHVTFAPAMPASIGVEPEPGGWKAPQHLDNPADLRDDGDYKGSLP